MLRNRQRLLSHLSRHFTLSAASVQVCMTVPVACVTSLSPSETDLNKLTPGNSGKSAKRKAAEALLQSRSVTASSHGDVEDTPLKRRHLSTAAHVCASTATHNSGSHLNAKQTSVSHWCDFDVCLPHLEWSRVVLSPALQVEKRLLPHPIRFPTYTLTNDVTVHVVEEASEVTEALRLLKDSMDDSMISIDLEWKPDYVRDTSRVALMQLSSSRCCLLLRLCKLGDQLPDALLEMFR